MGVFEELVDYQLRIFSQAKLLRNDYQTKFCCVRHNRAELIIFVPSRLEAIQLRWPQTVPDGGGAKEAQKYK